VGSLSLPSSGTVYMDANCIIYSVERIEPYRTLLEPLWLASGPTTFWLASSELTLLEALVGPLKTGDARLETNFRTILQHSSDVQLIPITLPILERAAQLRAATSLKTPDAIHAATALEHGCTLFVTNDTAFRRVPGLPVTTLADLLMP